MTKATVMHKLVHSKFGTGLRPDVADFRDIYFKDTKYKKGFKIPNQIDWTSRIEAPWDQGEIGSCVAHGVGSLIKYVYPNLMPSRLKLYYDGRVLENTVRIDSGLEIRDGIKVTVKTGVCAENLWPYNTSRFKNKPPSNCYVTTNEKLITEYARVTNNIDEILNCLAQGSPVVYGATLYESFESDKVAKTGIVSMPLTTEKPIGGHCTTIFGADVKKKLFLVRNSWGTSWGDPKHPGYFWLPFDYIANQDLTSDMWMITK